MIRMTIATDERGNVVGAVQHTAANAQLRGGGDAGGAFGPEHKLHEVEVGQELDMTKVKDVAAFHSALKRHVPKAR